MVVFLLDGVSTCPKLCVATMVVDDALHMINCIVGNIHQKNISPRQVPNNELYSGIFPVKHFIKASATILQNQFYSHSVHMA